MSKRVYSGWPSHSHGSLADIGKIVTWTNGRLGAVIRAYFLTIVDDSGSNVTHRERR